MPQRGGSEAHLTLVRLGVLACAVTSALLALVYLPQAIDRFDDRARFDAAMNFDDREFAGGNAIVVDKAALYEARASIPEDETYRVVVGPELKGATALTSDYIEQFARYFLIPRRPADGASWVLCYGCDPHALGGRFDEVWRDDAGIELVRLER